MRHTSGSANRGFVDRRDAGRRLGDALVPLVEGIPRARLLVLGLARGGVVVAAEVAAILGVALDACVVRKIGSPHQPELAIGAIGPADVRIYNQTLIRTLGIPPDVMDRLTATVEADREALDLALRGSRPLPNLEDRTVILVDDGLATGASMRAAAEFAQASAQAVVIAIPTASPEVVRSFESRGYQTVSLIVSPRFGSVGQWYAHFEEVSSDATRSILEAAWGTERGD